MKRKVPIGLAVIGVVIAVFVTFGRRTRQAPAVSYQGIPVTEWVTFLYQSSNPQSTNVVIAFQAMGTNAVPALQKILRTKEPWYARLCMQLGKILPRGMRSYLIRTTGQAASQRVAAARALSIMGTNATAAVPDLIDALADPETRWVGAQALADIKGPAIAALTVATTNKDMNVRHAAVYGLGQAGTDALPATVFLLDRVLDLSLPVRASAVYSINQMGRPGLATVLEAYSSESAERREAAVKALKALNTPPRQIVSSLLEFTSDSSPRLRQNSLEVLNGLRSNHPRVIANYFKAAADSDVGVRMTAARALAQANNWSTNATFGGLVAHQLGRESTNLQSNAVETLTGLLSDSEMPVREAARQSLASLQASSTN